MTPLPRPCVWQRVWFGIDALGAKPAGGKSKDVVTGAPFRLNWANFWTSLLSTSATATMVWNQTSVGELRQALATAELGLDRCRRMEKRKRMGQRRVGQGR